MNNYWSELVNSLQPYVPGEQPQDQQYIKLNTNENPYPPSPKVLRQVQASVNESLRLYPDPQALTLRRSIASAFGMGTNNVFVGNGSDEVLAFAFMAFFTGKPAIQFPEISYSFYPVYCNLFGIEAKKIALNDDFSIDLADYADDSGGIIFPNPNAPTGRLIALGDIESLLKRNTASVVVVDEAYIDFGGESAASLVGLYPNLLVIQTFSKSRSLAGMRVGYALGDVGLIEALERVKDSFNSYPLDRLAQVAATEAMQDAIYFNNIRRKIIETRERTAKGLQGLGFEVVPSQANFVFARHPRFSGEALYRSLKAAGILVRHFNKPGIEQYLRVSIGTDDEMETLLERLPAAMQAAGA
ncbi:MAG: histidinol-phosphate transaminase [Gammaproteobacteria bacterium]|nr:histidinol-phosphate transaminase [Gammaproteobacteria bacterium]